MLKCIYTLIIKSLYIEYLISVNNKSAIPNQFQHYN